MVHDEIHFWRDTLCVTQPRGKLIQTFDGGAAHTARCVRRGGWRSRSPALCFVSLLRLTRSVKQFSFRFRAVTGWVELTFTFAILRCVARVASNVRKDDINAQEAAACVSTNLTVRVTGGLARFALVHILTFVRALIVLEAGITAESRKVERAKKK